MLHGDPGTSPLAGTLRAVTNPQHDSAEGTGSPALQTLGLIMLLGGVAIIFAGEFEILPRSGLTSGLGAGIALLGVWANWRGRAAKGS